MTRTTKASSLVLAAAVLGLTGGAVLAQARPAAGHAPVTVTLMTWQSAHTNGLILNALKPLERRYPWIHVKNIPTPSSDYYQKLDTMFTAHNLPDLFWSGNEHEQDWGSENLLYNWSQYAKRPGVPWFNLKKYAPDSIINWRVKGQLYGLPTFMNTYGYYYNVKLFKAAHLPLPKPGWTYAQFFHDAKVLTEKAGGKVTQYGVILPQDSAWYMGQYAFSAGGLPFENRITDPTKVTAAKQFVRGTQLWVKAIRAGWVSPPTYTVSNSTAVFATGKVPMMGGGQWLTTAILPEHPKFAWGWAPNPIVKGQVEPYDAVGIASPAHLADPKAVWLVLSYLDTVALGHVLYQHPVASPAYLPSAHFYYQALRKAGEPSVAASVNYELRAKNKIPIKFLAPWAGAADNVITADWNNILLGKTPAYRGINHMVFQINQTIKTQAP